MLPKLSITEWTCKKRRPHFRNIATGVKEKGSTYGEFQVPGMRFRALIEDNNQ